MAMKIRPVRTERDYDAALRDIDRLFRAKPGTPEHDRFEILLALVEKYEEQHYPMAPPDPVDAIKFHMERKGLTRKDLEPLLGSRARVSEILNRNRPLTLAMIRRLHATWQIPAESLIASPRARRAA